MPDKAEAFSKDVIPYSYLTSDRKKLVRALIEEAEICLESKEGLLLAEPMPFDSQLLGMRCYRLLACLSRNGKLMEKKALLGKLLSRKELEFFYCRCDVRDHLLKQALLEAGFQLITTEIQFQWTKEQLRSLQRIPRPEGITVRLGRACDLEHLKPFARYFTTNRFAQDRSIPTASARKVYEQWIENALLGNIEQEDEVLVAEKENQIVAFATTNVNRKLSRACGKRVGTPGLTAVKPLFRKRNINPYLMAKSLISLLKRCDLALAPSHITNFSMINSELKTYPRIVAAEYIFHFHRFLKEG